jgi:hypothetical protein
MPNPPVRDSGTEFALEALSGQIKAYTDNVNRQFDKFDKRFDKMEEKVEDVHKKLSAHAAEEMKWRVAFEKRVHEALAYGERLNKLEQTVDEHDDFFQQSKGAVWAGKFMWLVVGALASTLVWGYATFVKPKDAPAAPSRVEHVEHPHSTPSLPSK